MSATYHKPTALCTANVPSQNETEPKRTPAMDGFQIMPAHRSEAGNVRWNLIFLDFADFLQVPRAEVLSGGRWTQRTVLEVAATSAGYDPRCVGALESSGGAYRRKFAAAAALGFDPIYLWPARAVTWPIKYQTLNGYARAAAPSNARSLISEAIASAEGFAVAIDCLPVGKDIRNRLQSHIQAHIYLLRLASGDPA